MKQMKLLPLIMMLLLLCASFAYAGEAAEKKKENVVFVPYEEIDKILGEGNRGVLLDAAEYRRLLKLAEEKTRPPQIPGNSTPKQTDKQSENQDKEDKDLA